MAVIGENVLTSMFLNNKTLPGGYEYADKTFVKFHTKNTPEMRNVVFALADIRNRMAPGVRETYDQRLADRVAQLPPELSLKLTHSADGRVKLEYPREQDQAQLQSALPAAPGGPGGPVLHPAPVKPQAPTPMQAGQSAAAPKVQPSMLPQGAPPPSAMQIRSLRVTGNRFAADASQLPMQAIAPQPVPAPVAPPRSDLELVMAFLDREQELNQCRDPVLAQTIIQKMKGIVDVMRPGDRQLYANMLTAARGKMNMFNIEARPAAAIHQDEEKAPPMQPFARPQPQQPQPFVPQMASVAAPVAIPISESQVIAFLSNEMRLIRADGTWGPYFNELMAQSLAELEKVPDMIQWVLYTVGSNGANPYAPKLYGDTINRLRANPFVKQQEDKGFMRYAETFGFVHNPQTGKLDLDIQRLGEALSAGEHNWKRMARMLEGVMLLGTPGLGIQLYAAITSEINRRRHLGGIWADQKNYVDVWSSKINQIWDEKLNKWVPTL